MAANEKTAPAKAVEHTITLTQGGVRGLSQMLTSPQWLKDDPDAMVLSLRACTLVEDILPDLGEMPEFKKDADAIAWESVTAPSFKLSEKHRETCKKALTHFIKGGSIPNGKTKRALILQFGLATED
jgi:hypothetical protein